MCGTHVSAPASSVPAFYDIEKSELILARPINNRSWSHIFNAFFHQLMPEESGSEISKLALILRPLMEASVSEAHSELTDAGVPYLSHELELSDEELRSPEINDIGSSLDIDGSSETELNGTPNDHSETSDNLKDYRDKLTSPTIPTIPSKPNEGDGGLRDKENEHPQKGQVSDSNKISLPTGTPTSGRGISPGDPVPISGKTKNKTRPKHKEQWDRRLLSYVRSKSDGSDEKGTNGELSEHNLFVEVVARKAVCDYEKARGRQSEEMPQTHPGYDIISTDTTTGEQRFIEVKGVNGEWNKTGVGLSRLQFSNAQDYGDQYWLYVVEHVSTPEHILVHPICSPATQVTSFMFDGNWRDAVTEQKADPKLRFAPEARIHHENHGAGVIASVTQKGTTRLLDIEFEEKGLIRNIPLNLYTMKICEEDYGDHDS